MNAVRTNRARRRRAEGFSIVELLIVVAITSVGFVALLNLQVATIRGLGYPAQMIDAVSLAEHFIGTLQMEAVEWTEVDGHSFDNGRLRYLPTAPASFGSFSEWNVAYDFGNDHSFTDLAGGDPTYDPGMQAEFPPQRTPRFCLHYRLAWVSENQRLLRADVRVLWLRDEASWARFKDCPVDMVDWPSEVQFVTLPAQVMVNETAVRS